MSLAPGVVVVVVVVVGCDIASRSSSAAVDIVVIAGVGIVSSSSFSERRISANVAVASLRIRIVTLFSHHDAPFVTTFSISGRVVVVVVVVATTLFIGDGFETSPVRCVGCRSR